MKKFFENVRKMSKNNIFMLFFLIILIIFCIFLFLNNYSIQLFVNGMNQIYSSEMQVYFLDVGQASANLIVFPNKTSLVIDTGSSDSEEAFMKSVREILHKNKINSIDYLILTHSDDDHVGGASALLKSFQVNHVLRPKILSTSPLEDKIEGYEVATTQSYAETITAVYSEANCQVDYIENSLISFGDNATLQIFAAEEEAYSDVNSYSPFIYVQSFGRSFMFSGDATSEREEEFLNQNSNLDINVDFLAVAHHGSRYSSTSEYLEKINPTYAIVSAGDNLHPSRDVIERLQECGVEKIYVTKEVGMIAVGVSENSVKIRTMSKFIDLPIFVVCILMIAFSIAHFKNLNVDKFSTKIYLNKRKKLLKN